MQQQRIIEICQERFRGWTAKLAQSHATPLIAVGVGHDEQNGQIVVCVVDDPSMTNEVIAGFLRSAVAQLEASR